MNIEQTRMTLEEAGYNSKIHTKSGHSVTDIVCSLIEKHPDRLCLQHQELLDLAKYLTFVSSFSIIKYKSQHIHAGQICLEEGWISVYTEDHNEIFYQITNDPNILIEECKNAEPEIYGLIRDEIIDKIKIIGGSPDNVKILNITKYNQDSFECKFHSDFSENGYYIAQISLQNKDVDTIEAASNILAHTKYANELNSIFDKRKNEFEALGFKYKSKVLLSAQFSPNGKKQYEIYGIFSMLGDMLEPYDAMIDLSLTANARSQRKQFKKWQTERTKVLGDFKNPMDAYQICPITAKSYLDMPLDELDKVYKNIENILSTKNFDDSYDFTGEFRNGKFIDKVVLGKGVVFRHQKLMIRQTTIPETVLMNLPGKPLIVICDHPYLEGLIIKSAENDHRGRCNIIVEKLQPLKFKNVYDAIRRRLDNQHEKTR